MSDAGKVDAYIKKHEQWQLTLARLRKVLLSTELVETVKWGAPAYTLQGKIIVSMAAFKQHCALWFHQGVFLQDKQKLLVNAQDGKTRALRHLRFEKDSKLDGKLVKAYLLEAIANARAGKQIKPETKVLLMPAELARALNKSRELQRAFAALTPGKQRQYAEHIGSAKQAATRLNRLASAMPMIKAGVGMNDKYRNS